MPSTISPRRRSRTPDVPATAIAPAAPIREIDAPPRVLIRLPNVATAAPLPTAKPPAAEPTIASATRIAQVRTWIAKLNTPRVQKYLPYTLAVVVAFGAFLLLRAHSGKSQPAAAESEAPAWNNGAALPNSQAGGLSPTGAGNVPNFNPSAPGTPAGSPSAYQPQSGYSGSSPMGPPANPAPPSSYQSNGVPANGWPGPGAPPNGGIGATPGAPNDSVPSMPARSPAWGNPVATGNPGFVQGAPVAPEYRTAQNIDPATIPPGRGANDPGEAGVARFEGMITRPPQQ
jgi:hypothetical protein